MTAWFGLCMASAAWIAFALGILLLAPPLAKVAAVPFFSVGVYLGWRAYLEDI